MESTAQPPDEVVLPEADLSHANVEDPVVVAAAAAVMEANEDLLLDGLTTSAATGSATDSATDTATGTNLTTAPAPTASVYREVLDPTELEAIVQQNPVLLAIRHHGAAAKREQVYPADSTAAYVYTFLQHFPPNAFALPQSFRKVIKGLHAGHWLSKKIEEIKNRRWRQGGGSKSNINTSSTTTTAAAGGGGTTNTHQATATGQPSVYGKIPYEEAVKLQRCNAAFWHAYVQQKPPDEVVQKRQAQYNRKTAAVHNKLSSAAAAAAGTSTTPHKKPPSSVPAPAPASTTGTDDLLMLPTTTIMATTSFTMDGGAVGDNDDPNPDSLLTTTTTTSTDTTRHQYTELVDEKDLDVLQAIVDTNPVLGKIRDYGPTAKREDVFPTSSSLQAEEYVYTYLRHFPTNTYALPHVFRKCVKSLNSSHWLAKKVDELFNRRWRIVPGAPYGRLRLDEVNKIKTANPAFWECYMQKRPSQDVILKKQAQYEKKTSHVKKARTSTGGGATTLVDGSTGGVTITTVDDKAALPTTTTSKLSKKTRLASRAAHNNSSTVVQQVVVPIVLPPATSECGRYTELKDPTATDLLQSIVQQNPVLTKIIQCGVKAKREEVYPKSSSLQAEEYVYTYLKHFPPNSFALPPTFRKVVKGLNASHWLAKKIIELKDRRWRNREGQETAFGRMTEGEVEKIKACNEAFWECYVNQRPPDEVLNKKRQQYARKTEHNKTSRASKKPKLGEIATGPGGTSEHGGNELEATAEIPDIVAAPSGEVEASETVFL